MHEASESALSELRQSAFELGANAVISVVLHYNQFSGKNKSMLFVVASGTAVKVTKLESPPDYDGEISVEKTD